MDTSTLQHEFDCSESCFKIPGRNACGEEAEQSLGLSLGCCVRCLVMSRAQSGRMTGCVGMAIVRLYLADPSMDASVVASSRMQMQRVHVVERLTDKAIRQVSWWSVRLPRVRETS